MKTTVQMMATPFSFDHKLRTALALMLMMSIASSCIRSEAPNAEADILAVQVEGIELLRPAVLTNNTITLYPPAWEEVTELAPVFELTPGATIEPKSGVARDFTTPKTYTVTSEDGQWTKEYLVSVVQKQPMRFSFENTRLHRHEGKEYFSIFYETGEQGEQVMEWASGNYGFSMTNRNAPATDYPTYQTEEGYVGKAACLVTRSTGAAGKLFRKPIAGGNLFIGELDQTQLLGNAEKATRFGTPLSEEPGYLSGYYRYTPGPTVTDKSSKKVEGAVDSFDIYAVVFDTSGGTNYLDGSNVLSHPDLVLIARVTEKHSDGAWHQFRVPFEPQNDKAIDPIKLRAGHYSYSIIFTSSINAAKFEGAVGSTLIVDEVELFTKEEKSTL